MLAFLGSHENAKTLAFAAALLCVWIAVMGASRAARKSPDLHLAAALFAVHWGVLLLYYIPGPPQNEILSSFSGVLLVYVGILLLRDARRTRGEKHELGWSDRLPLHLFRVTVGGFGGYLIARRFFHLELGLGTLALAMWGTLLTVSGYVAIWVGARALYAGTASRHRTLLWLGILLALYSGWEVAFSVWYARDYWPTYHRYLSLGSRRNGPDPEQALPFHQGPGWPHPERWAALRESPDWPETERSLSLKVEPRVPDPPLALEYGFALLKILFTLAFFWVVGTRPVPEDEARPADAPEGQAGTVPATDRTPPVPRPRSAPRSASRLR